MRTAIGGGGAAFKEWLGVPCFANTLGIVEKHICQRADSDGLEFQCARVHVRGSHAGVTARHGYRPILRGIAVISVAVLSLSGAGGWNNYALANRSKVEGQSASHTQVYSDVCTFNL